jgi:hypothetical protein
MDRVTRTVFTLGVSIFKYEKTNMGIILLALYDCAYASTDVLPFILLILMTVCHFSFPERL